MNSLLDSNHRLQQQLPFAAVWEINATRFFNASILNPFISSAAGFRQDNQTWRGNDIINGIVPIWGFLKEVITFAKIWSWAVAASSWSHSSLPFSLNASMSGCAGCSASAHRLADSLMLVWCIDDLDPSWERVNAWDGSCCQYAVVLETDSKPATSDFHRSTNPGCNINYLYRYYFISSTSFVFLPNDFLAGIKA